MYFNCNKSISILYLNASKKIILLAALNFCSSSTVFSFYKSKKIVTCLLILKSVRNALQEFRQHK